MKSLCVSLERPKVGWFWTLYLSPCVPNFVPLSFFLQSKLMLREEVQAVVVHTLNKERRDPFTTLSKLEWIPSIQSNERESIFTKDSKIWSLPGSHESFTLCVYVSKENVESAATAAVNSLHGGGACQGKTCMANNFMSRNSLCTWLIVNEIPNKSPQSEIKCLGVKYRCIQWR